MEEKKLRRFRYEYEMIDENNNPYDWGWDVVLSPNFRSAKKWIFKNYTAEALNCAKVEINYIAEIMYEREAEE